MKDKIYKLFFACITLFYASNIFAQSTQQSMHDKYWFYRYRLTHEFMKKGLGQCGIPSGYSVPAEAAYQQGICDLHFGDGTSFLGNYIGVLATEYDLMNRDGASIKQKNRLMQELYYAMKAYERLDKNAEISFNPFGGSCNDDVNGFFARDDVPTANIYLTDFPLSLNPKGETKTLKSDYIDGKDATPCTPSPYRFNSPDQISNLLVGFALVTKNFGSGEYYTEQNNGHFNFRAQAQRYADALMKYLNRSDYTLPIEGSSDSFGKVCYAQHGTIETVDLAYAFAEAGNKIRNADFGNDQVITFGVAPDNPYAANSQAVPLSQPLWEQVFNYPLGDALVQYNYDHHDNNNAIFLQLAAIGNSWKVGMQQTERHVIIGHYIDKHCDGTDCIVGNPWGGCLVEIETGCTFVVKDITVTEYCYTPPGLFEICSPFKFPEFTLNTTSTALSSYGNIMKGWYFPLLHQYLHNCGSYSYHSDDLFNELKIAPCTGPHYKPFRDINNPPPADINGDPNWDVTSNSEGVEGWRVDNRWEKSNAATNSPSSGANNGIDYMIAYNLFHLVKGGDEGFPSYVDMLNREVNNQTYPKTNQGSNQSPLTIIGFETITANNVTVNTNGNVTFHAGESIKIDNSSIKSGSTFKAYINPVFGCVGNSSGNTSYQKTAEPIATTTKTTSNGSNSPSAIAAFQKDLKDKSNEISQAQKNTLNPKSYKPLSTYLKESSSSAEAVLYPNPATNILYVQKAKFDSEQLDIQILDVTGNVQLSSSFMVQQGSNESTSIDIHLLEPGYYFCKIKSGGYTKTLQFIKN